MPCCVLHRIAFPVVSEWYQEPVVRTPVDHASDSIASQTCDKSVIER
jgi:hypothetical protein